MKALLTILLSLTTALAAPPCAFPIPMDNTEVWGLVHAPAATSPDACAAACCDMGGNCTIYQWCSAGGSCSPSLSCWIGTSGGETQRVTGWISARRLAPRAPLTVNCSAPVPPPVSIPGMPTVTRADASSLGVSTSGFFLYDRPFFAVAGELHFSRVEASAWAADLRAMRAGGLTTVSAYVIMNHHNEDEGVYDWSGQRNLTAFLFAARDAGLLVSLRIGPYVHGEVRGGGMPDWLQAVPGIALRTTQPLFMRYATAWYSAVRTQCAGLMWQEGGPVITIQVDNESGDAAYLVALKAAAVSVGLHPPFFTATGMNKVPYGSMLPLTGMYPVAFWDGGGNGTSSDYLFAPPDAAGSGYPTLWCELGGGMVSVYCTRHRVGAMDIVASAYIAAARSSDVGYYMFHGGINPLGLHTTLQEHQAYYNGQWDLTVATYDFVAPIGASGAVHAQYHGLRALHLLTAALGEWLAPAATSLPATLPSGADDGDTLRWSARYDGLGSALLFFSTYARDLKFSPQNETRVMVLLPNATTLLVPAASSPTLNLPLGTSWAWPIYPPLPAGLRLAYALAQPAGTVFAPHAVILLIATSGVPTELCFDADSIHRVVSCAGTCSTEGGSFFARALPPGRGVALEVIGADGVTHVSFVVLSSDDGEHLWVGHVAGVPRAFLTAGGDILEFDDDSRGAVSGEGTLRVRSEAGGGATELCILPPPAAFERGGVPITPSGTDGVFTAYALPVAACGISVAFVQAGGGALPPLSPTGAAGHPVAPGNDGTLSDAWSAAAVFNISVMGGGTVAADVDVRLVFDWVGDVARLYSSAAPDAGMESLLGDAFFNNADTRATLWTVSLSRTLAIIPESLTLRVIPLHPSARIALDEWPVFGTGPGGSALELTSVDAVCTTTITLDVTR